MKRLSIILAGVLAVSGAWLIAADPPESSFGLAPAPAAPLQPAATPEPGGNISLIPDAAATPAPTGTPKNQTLEQEDLLHKRIQIRKAFSKALRDPGLQAVKAQADVAKTDFEMRKLYIDYYNGLVDLVAKIDPTITKAELDSLRNAYVGRYIQNRIEPTVDPATFRKSR